MMTRTLKRIMHWLNPRKQFGTPPAHIFWEALLAIQWRYFEEVLQDYVQTGRSPEHIYHSFSTIDCWLDLACEYGWMNEDSTTK